MSLDNPHTIPPIEMYRPHEHRCEVCGGMYYCFIFCEPDDIYIYNECERREGR